MLIIITGLITFIVFILFIFSLCRISKISDERMKEIINKED